jgi:hypothetical protein
MAIRIRKRVRPTRGDRVIRWIADYCDDGGHPVSLSRDQRNHIYRIYDHRDGVTPAPTEGKLAAYLILAHLASKEAFEFPPPPEYQTDPFTLWAAASPALRPYLHRHGAVVSNPELARAWRAA